MNDVTLYTNNNTGEAQSGDTYILFVPAKLWPRQHDTLIVWLDDELAYHCGFNNEGKSLCPDLQEETLLKYLSYYFVATEEQKQRFEEIVRGQNEQASG